MNIPLSISLRLTMAIGVLVYGAAGIRESYAQGGAGIPDAAYSRMVVTNFEILHQALAERCQAANIPPVTNMTGISQLNAIDAKIRQIVPRYIDWTVPFGMEYGYSNFTVKGLWKMLGIGDLNGNFTRVAPATDRPWRIAQADFDERMTVLHALRWAMLYASNDTVGVSAEAYPGEGTLEETKALCESRFLDAVAAGGVPQGYSPSYTANLTCDISATLRLCWGAVVYPVSVLPAMDGVAECCKQTTDLLYRSGGTFEYSCVYSNVVVETVPLSGVDLIIEYPYSGIPPWPPFTYPPDETASRWHDEWGYMVAKPVFKY